MLQRIRNFLQAIFQQLCPASFSSAEQATQQVVLERDTDALYPISIMKKDLDETERIPVMPVPVRESTTEPYRALIRLKNPAQRYRDLDIMLEQLKRDRLNKTDTQFVPVAVHKSARHLQRNIEQQEER